LLVNPDDTEDLANKIVKLSQGPFKIMGQYARNIVEREYDLEEVMKHQISYYKALLN
jgi:glycosyltransferase involved in cell wall biosynthesis